MGRILEEHRGQATLPAPRLGIINEWNQEDLQDPGAVHEDVAKGREKDHHSGLAT